MTLIEYSLAVFSGPDSIKDFLHPENQITPMVELPAVLNPFLKDGVHIFAKCEYLRPLLNIKSLQVLGMLKDAQNQGMLTGVHTLVENTSGNTGFSLGVIAKVFGIPNVKLVVPYDIAPGKIEMLRIAGTQIEPCKTGGIQKAREMGAHDGFLNLDQYANPANPQAIERWIAPQIWRQTGGKISVFCAGLGTTGTIIGVAQFLKRVKSKALIVGVNLAPDHAVPGVRTLKRLEESSLDWGLLVDYRVEMEAKESYKKSLELCRLGIVAGPSSGFALAGLLKFLSQHDSNLHRNEDGEVVAVFICPDTPFPYLDKYSTYLDPEDF